MNVCLKTLGCRLNEAELEHWASGFIQSGHTIINEPDNADLVVINTCAVTREAEKKSRQLIRRSQRNNPTAKLVVSGCYATLHSGSTEKISGVDLVVPNADKDALVNIVKQNLTLEAMPNLATEPDESSLFARRRNRAFIKVQDGCRYRCTFCIVTAARGLERSRPVADIIETVNRLHFQNIKEVILTGVHIGGYGSDMNTSLVQLIKALLAETDVPRLRLGSVEPWDLGEDFLALFENPKMMPHLHLPLQSGNDAVLRRMARRCKTADFEILVSKARQYVPDMNITTDIIVGFPGETEQEWQSSMAFIERIGFSHIHIFPYSKRTGTKAATLPDQVDIAVKKRRTQELHQLAQAMRLDFMRRFNGATLPVLFEHKEDNVDTDRRYHYGYTSNYLRVRVLTNNNDNAALSLQNSILPVTITGIDKSGNVLAGCLINDH